MHSFKIGQSVANLPVVILNVGIFSSFPQVQSASIPYRNFENLDTGGSDIESLFDFHPLYLLFVTHEKLQLLIPKSFLNDFSLV